MEGAANWTKNYEGEKPSYPNERDTTDTNGVDVDALSESLQDLRRRIRILEKAGAAHWRSSSDKAAVKAWEGSLFRRVAVAVFTYGIATATMVLMRVETPYLASVIPTLGYLLSTLTFMPCFFPLWRRYFFVDDQPDVANVLKSKADHGWPSQSDLDAEGEVGMAVGAAGSVALHISSAGASRAASTRAAIHSKSYTPSPGKSPFFQTTELQDLRHTDFENQAEERDAASGLRNPV